MRMVRIEWEDAWNGFHDWITSDTIPDEIDPLVFHTIGFVLRESDHRITLVMSHNIDPDQAQFCDLFTIPKACIRKIKELK